MKRFETTRCMIIGAIYIVDWNWCGNSRQESQVELQIGNHQNMSIMHNDLGVAGTAAVGSTSKA